LVPPQKVTTAYNIWILRCNYFLAFRKALSWGLNFFATNWSTLIYADLKNAQHFTEKKNWR
jgi:hypothetical protein